MNVSLALPSKIVEIDAFMKYLLELLESDDFGANDVLAIQLAVDEALKNAATHDNQLDCRKRIYLRFSVGSKGFYIQIRAEGAGFDREGVPGPTDQCSLKRPSGRGLWLIHSCMHRVRFNAKRNVMILWRRRTRTHVHPPIG
jgi:anti-sigma regulatory factor (Ser/Thr protein kinase)